MKKLLFLLIFNTVLTAGLYAQSKIKDGSLTGTSSLPNSNAILELESNKKGLMLPRVALTDTLLSAPLTAHIKGMVVYDTATNVSTGISPGIYYNDGTKWIKGIANTNAWLVLGNGGTNSGINTIGNAADGNYVGTSDTSKFVLGVNGTKRMIFDQYGNAYGGDGSTAVQTTAGAISSNNSRNFVWGNNNQITTNSANGGARSNAVFGGGNKIIGDYFGVNLGAQNLITGSGNTVIGSGSLVAGLNNSDTASQSFVAGGNNIMGRLASYGVAIGRYLTVSSANQTAFGIYNKDTLTAAFAIGTGTGAGTLTSNAITVSNGGTVLANNGNIGINNVNNPLKRLHINAANSTGAMDSLKIDNLATTTSALNKSVLVLDSTTGYLSKIAASSLSSNIYTADGTLTGIRTLTMAGNNLQFYNAGATGGTTVFSNSNGADLSLTPTSATGRASLSLLTGTSSLYAFVDGGNAAQLTTNATSLNIGTFSTAPVSFFTNNVERMRILSAGNVGIGSGVTPTSTLQVAGSVSAAIRTTNTSTTLTATDHTLILTGVSTANSITVTLPQASTCPGRMYVIVNYTATTSPSVTQISQVIRSYDGVTTELKATFGTSANTASYNTGAATSGSLTSERMIWQSDGSVWYLINRG